MINELQIIEHHSQRVLTTQLLANEYETDAKRISENFIRNQERYIYGKHYFTLEGKEKHDFLNLPQIADGLKNAAVIYLWTEAGALLHAKSLNTDKAWEVYDYLVDNYFRVKEQIVSLDSYMIADPVKRAERWIEEAKERQALAIERDEAVRTKSYIGSRREASSMATASRAMRQVRKLEEALGYGKTYKQVKAIEWLSEYFDLTIPGAYSQIGKSLTALSEVMDLAPHNVPDEKYPAGVKAYHIAVINSFRQTIEQNPCVLQKYRRNISL